MKKLFFLVLIFSAFYASAQKGTMFPSLTGQTLTDKNITIPAQTKGKYTLIGIAYSQKSDDLLKQWFNPIYNTFLAPPSEEGGFIPENAYDVNVYFIPMISGIKQAAGNKIEKEMKEKVDKKLHPNVLVYTGAIKDYKEKLKFGDKELPYFYVLDETGKIVYTTSGAYSESKLDEVEEMLSGDEE